MLCFPTFFLILAVIAMLEPSIWYIMIIIGLPAATSCSTVKLAARDWKRR